VRANWFPRLARDTLNTVKAWLFLRNCTMPSLSWRLVGFFTLAIALLSGSAWAQEDKPAEEAVERPALTDEQAVAVANVVRILDQETKVDVIRTPFQDVLRDLGTVHKITITIDPVGLRRAGVTRNMQVTLNEKGITLRGFMPKLLKPLGLTYRVRPDGLLITSSAPPPVEKDEPGK
jgi:hypothetical protein